MHTYCAVGHLAFLSKIVLGGQFGLNWPKPFATVQCVVGGAGQACDLRPDEISISVNRRLDLVSANVSWLNLRGTLDMISSPFVIL